MHKLIGALAFVLVLPVYAAQTFIAIVVAKPGEGVTLADGSALTLRESGELYHDATAVGYGSTIVQIGAPAVGVGTTIVAIRLRTWANGRSRPQDWYEWKDGWVRSTDPVLLLNQLGK